jgi:DUF2075 family protein/DNA polymerase III delta prime subunit
MPRSYYSQNLEDFFTDNTNFILGKLTKNHQFTLEEQQRNTWIKQIDILKNELRGLTSGHILFEYSIPRMGKRADIILIHSGFVFVIEFKVNATQYHSADIEQCLDYALDLKNFQEGSHNISLVPILISTKAQKFQNILEKYPDGIFKPLKCNSDNIRETIDSVCKKFTGDKIDSIQWENSQYKPTPTIIEAAQALYQGHDVKEIARSDSGADNLVKTAEAINQIIEKSKKEKIKSICFITGVPGAGKTLAGLNLANERHNFEEEEHAVFLSGNGPLVAVLQEALARDQAKNSEITKTEALRKSKAFIQNIHFFRDEALDNQNPPIEKVVVFDEAQRAWNLKQTASFMKKKRGHDNFNQSEPEFLISVLDRHDDWAVIICLIGGGQEINVGEAGLPGWFTAIKNHYLNWHVYISPEITDIEYTRGNELGKLLSGIKYQSDKNLHLKTSMRSFRNKNVSEFVKEILDCKKDNATKLYSQLKENYPFVITRNINTAKQWIKNKARANERFGLVASSNAKRLKPYGIFVEIDINAPNWFLNPKDDVRSSYYLEYVATEFSIQGLELDWTCIAWDADMRLENNSWNYYDFMGTKWRNVKDEENRLYHKNTYRVLLTRARQGLVIFIPKGDETDHTRPPEFYDNVYNYFKEIGIEEI